MGRTYRRLLEDEVVRLGLLAGLELEADVLREMARTMPFDQLERMKKACGKQAEKHYPLKPQLEYGEKTTVRQETDRAILI